MPSIILMLNKIVFNPTLCGSIALTDKKQQQRCKNVDFNKQQQKQQYHSLS